MDGVPSLTPTYHPPHSYVRPSPFTVKDVLRVLVLMQDANMVTAYDKYTSEGDLLALHRLGQRLQAPAVHEMVRASLLLPAVQVTPTTMLLARELLCLRPFFTAHWKALAARHGLGVDDCSSNWDSGNGGTYHARCALSGRWG